MKQNIKSNVGEKKNDKKNCLNIHKIDFFVNIAMREQNRGRFFFENIDTFSTE